jgi:hypothetical protein
MQNRIRDVLLCPIASYTGQVSAINRQKAKLTWIFVDLAVDRTIEAM